MASDYLIDNAQRKKFALIAILTTLVFLHIWASVLIVAASIYGRKDMDGETIRVMFSSVTTGIGICLLILISDKFLDFVISRFTGAVSLPQTIEKTTTEKTVITPSEQPVKDMTVNAENVNVSS